MNTSSPTRRLRERADIHQLRRQAKELLASYVAGDQAAATEVRLHFRDANPSTFALHDAQLVIARAYGFQSWPKLKAHVDGVTVERLCHAVRDGDVAEVRAMLNVRPELANMELPEDGHRPLHYAVYNRSAEMVRILMENGADARREIWPNRDGTSAFTVAHDRGYDELVQIILEHEHRHPSPSRVFDPPAELFAAVQARDDARVIAFLEKNPAFINEIHDAIAPLHLAAALLWESLLLWLLDHGADVNLRARNGPSAIEFVGRLSQPDPSKVAHIASILRSRGAEMTARAAIATGDEDWIRAWHAEGKLVQTGLLEVAVQHGRREMLTLLLDLGFDPDEPVPQGDGEEVRRGGPLLACARKRDTSMAELLLERGATLTPGVAIWLGKSEWLRQHLAAGKPGDGLITLAIQHSRPEILTLLLDLGLDPNERSLRSAGGPLRECAKPGRLEMAKILLDRGADPNAHDLYESSPLYEAYTEKNPEMIQLLVSYGGYLNAPEVGYTRQVEIARKMLAGEIDPHSESTGYSGKTTEEQFLYSGANSGATEIVRLALEHIDWSRDDRRWYDALSKILPDQARWNDEQRERYIASFLLILDRCSPNLSSNHGRTILHEVIASDFGDGAQLAKMLLDAGARTDVRDHLLQSTPLGWACRWGRVEIAELLLEKGADPVEDDAEPWATPKSWAEKMNQDEVLRILRNYGA